MHGDHEYLMADVDFALASLGVDYLDIIVLCRVPNQEQVPIEKTMQALASIVATGIASCWF